MAPPVVCRIRLEGFGGARSFGFGGLEFAPSWLDQYIIALIALMAAITTTAHRVT